MAGWAESSALLAGGCDSVLDLSLGRDRRRRVAVTGMPGMGISGGVFDRYAQIPRQTQNRNCSGVLQPVDLCDIRQTPDYSIPRVVATGS